MNKQLEDMLCNYLGQLLHEQETSFDWGENIKVREKINAVNLLLDIKQPEKKRRDYLKYLGFHSVNS